MFDHHLGGIGIGEFTVDEYIRDHFPEYPVPYIDTLITFQMKFFRQVFSDKFHQPVIAFDQVYANIVSIVVTVDILDAHNGIGFKMRQYTGYHLIFAKQ